MNAIRTIAIFCCLFTLLSFDVNAQSAVAAGDSVVYAKSGKRVILGTHNSATSGKTVWWQRLFSWAISPTSRCQTKSIEEQLLGGVRLFNLQVCRYKGEWHISHGLSIYEEKLFDILDQMKKYKGIVFQLYLDKNFFVDFEPLFLQIEKMFNAN